MLKDFREWSNPVKELLKLVQKPDKCALFENPAAGAYVGFNGKMILLGDCAHASTPHCGAGVWMAIEDAATIATLIGEVRSRDNLRSAFHIYDEARRERTQRLVRKSRETGLLYDFELENVGDSLARLIADTGERYKWIWEFENEGAAHEAKEALILKRHSCVD